MPSYDLSLSTDFGGTINPDQYTNEFNASAIVGTLTSIDVTGDIIRVTTLAALSAGDQTLLVTLAGTHTTTKIPRPGFKLPRFNKNNLPNATRPGKIIYVNNEIGGGVPAFSDGTDWRRFTDRAIVS